MTSPQFDRYTLFGLEISSAIPLRDVPIGDATQDVDVTMRLALTLAADAIGADGIVQDADGIAMAVPGVAHYRISDGRSIAVAPAPGAQARDIELFLLGTAFGLLLQQRGALILHANALTSEGRAIAVMGPSGAGKSTLAAHLSAAGFALLSDDLCVLDFEADALPMVQPGLARYRLWGDAVAALGLDAASLEPVRNDADKYVVAPEQALGARAPLAAVYVLDRASTSNPAGFERLIGADAIAALMANSYRGQYLDLSEGRAHHFDRCVALARAVPVTRWYRPWGREHEATNAASLIAHFQEL